MVTWPDNSKVPHLFFHTLVVDPDRAFAKTLRSAAGNEQYMVTIDEFRKILDALYAKNFVLVHPQRLASKDAKGVMHWTPLQVPQGKTPLIISFDDISYNSNIANQGYASRLILDGSGKVTNEYTDAQGQQHVGSYDGVPVLDDFVAAHPDFSLGGDKATVALTGYEGVLGYKTSKFVYGDNDTTNGEIAKAKAVADAMKATGWNFASHSYGHKNYTKLSAAQIQSDMGRWLNDVPPVIGPTNMLIYAFGADISDIKRYVPANPKYAYLQSVGFDYFFNVDGTTAAWYQLQPGSLRGARLNIDGITISRAIYGKQKVVPLFFDPKAIVDPKRPLPTPGS